MNHALAHVGGRTFASIRKYRNYRLYLAGQAVSFTGTWMQQIAASWLVLQMTHSAVAVGALALAQLLPVTVFAPLGGLFAGGMTAVGGTLLAFSIGGVLSLGMAAVGIARLSTRPA